MIDLTKILPQQSRTVEAIYAAYKKRGDSEQPRGYLGASIIGHSCERYLWYTFRACCKPEFSGRMYRLLDTGNWAEDRFVIDLQNIGCEVHDRDDNDRQFAVETLGGHFSGHLDSCTLGIPEAPKTWHVCEFKTHNSKSFAKLCKEGVKVTKPSHYAQMMVYMGLTGMTRALYLAVNKDTDELYSERVRFNQGEYDTLIARAKRIILATAPPDRISERPDYWECKNCDAHKICFGGDIALPVPALNCRQCCYATPTMDGGARWVCEKHRRGLSLQDQAKCCEDHLVLPGLVSFAEPIDSSNEWIDFHNNDEPGAAAEWRHGNGEGCFNSRELTLIPVSKISNQFLAEAKALFSASVTDYAADDILHRYPESDTRGMWRGPAHKLVDAWKTIYQEDIMQLTPLTQCDTDEYKVVEYEHDRIAILWNVNQKGSSEEAEIREGIS